MTPILIQLQPWRKAAAARVNVYVGDSPSADAYGLGGFDWEPAITGRPTLSLEFMSPTLDGKVQTGKARFVVQLNSIKNVADIATLDFQGAPVTIWSVDALAWDQAVVEFTGNVGTARYDLDTGLLTVDCEASTLLIEKPLLTLSYSGGGGINGETGKRGQLRPAGFGIVEYIEPVWFDETNNIGQIDGYGNTLSVQRVMEGANDLGASVGDYANYTALQAAIAAHTVPRGRWATCLADGLIGLGAPPAGVIGVNATFGFGKPGSMMQRIVQFHAGVPVGQIDTASFTSITTQVETVFSGAAANIGYWTSSQRQVKDLLEAVAGSVNATPIVTFQGIVTVTRGVSSAPVAILNRSGSVEPRVINWKSADSDPPFYQLKARTARPARVLNRDEVNYVDQLVDMGVWAAGTGYRIGNTVFGADGAQFLYINATPTVGPALPASTYPPAALASNAYWQQLTRPVPTSGSMIGVADGATANLTLTSIGSQAVTIAGNSFTRNAGTGDYSAAVRGTSILGPIYAEEDISPGANWTVLALDDDATAFTQGAMLFYLSYQASTGIWAILQNGASLYSGTTTAGLTGKLRIAYDGIRFRAYIGATQMGSDVAASASNLVLWPKWFGYSAATYTGVAAGPYNSNIWPDIDGIGRPANSATANFLLIALDANVRAIGNELLAVTSTSSSAYASIPALGSAELAWKADVASNHNFICGFVLAANVASTTQSTLAYGLEVAAATLYVWIAGVQTSLGAAVAGDRYRITYDGVSFRAFRNGTEITAALKAAAAGSTYFGRVGLNGTAGVKLTEVAFASFTQNNFSDIGGATVPSPSATADLQLTSIGATTVAPIGNTILRPSGADDYTACVRGNPMTGNAYAEVIIPASGYAMVALDDDATSTSLASLNIAVHALAGTTTAVNVYMAGDPITLGTVAGNQAGKKLAVSYDGVRYRVYVDGAPFGIDMAAAAGLRLWPKWHSYSAGVTIVGLRQLTNTSNLWADIDGPYRPSDGAGTTLNLYDAGGTYYLIQGNLVRKTGAAGWTYNVYSKEFAADTAFVSGTLDTINTFIGLSDNREATGSGDYGYLDFSVHRSGDGHWYAFESGAPTDLGTGFTAATQWLITYDGVNVTYRADATQPRQVATTAGRRFYAGVSVYSPAGQVSNVQFGPYTDRYLDNLGDGATYGKTRLTELTGGLLRLTQAGGGRRLGDSKALPNVAGNNLGFIFGGTISYTSAAGAPATATISITAGTVTAGSATTSYNALSVGVSGTGGTTPRYYLYVNDPSNAGGAQTLVATTSLTTVLSGDGYVYLGYCDVFFPTSGTGSGGGTGGIGCVWEFAWVETRDRGWVQARDIRPIEDWIKALACGGNEFEWVQVEAIDFAYEECFRVRAENGFVVTISWSTPIQLRDGRLTDVLHIPGHELPVDVGHLDWSVCTIEEAGRLPVAKIRCHQSTYSAGDIAGQGILTHNPKP